MLEASWGIGLQVRGFEADHDRCGPTATRVFHVRIMLTQMGARGSLVPGEFFQ